MTGFINNAIGVAFIVLVGNTIVNTAVAVFPEPKAIIIHRIWVDDGKVHQDRTVRTREFSPTLAAHWVASVIDVSTGEAVPWCSGSGWSAYRIGKLERVYPLEEWVGSASCTYESLPPGRYIPEAVWQWNEEQISVRGEVFEK